MHTLCRDCFHLVAEEVAACPACGSHRTLSHTALTQLNIAHIDCDAFFAAIEKRDNPDLKDKPVIVGGGKRGVVSTCCYIARIYGVRSAMPIFKARQLCPDGVFVPPDPEKYSAAAAVIREKMLALTPLVQPVSIDEAYLDLSGTETMHGAPPAVMLARFASEIESEVKITVSIGLASNRFLAKTASELDKPRGFAAISVDEAEALLAPYPVGFLHGVGPKLAEKMSRDGLETVGDLQACELKHLIQRYGENGVWLKQRAHGQDNRPVTPGSERKSISAETTFSEDVSDAGQMEDHLWRLCVKTADRAKAVDLAGSVITLKLKTAQFRPLTRQVSLHAPTQLAQEIFRASQPLLQREANGRTQFRLIGVGLSELSPFRSDSPDLIDPKVAKRAAAERASDAARAKFGKDAVVTGRAARMKQNKPR